MSLDELAMFLALAEAGSMTAVARQQGIPKSTVSRSLRRLEDALGTRLFERSTRHLRLSADGQHLLEQTQPLVERLRDTLQQLGHRSATAPQGLLRISAPYEFGLLRLGEVINDMLAQYPGLEIDVELSSRVPDPRSEPYDVVFRLQSTPLPDSDQVARRVYGLERCLVAAPALIARHGAPQSLSELAALPCLSNPEEPEWLLRDAQGTQHNFRPIARLRTANGALRLQSALAGQGVALLATRFCRADIEAGRLQTLLPAYAPVHSLMYALLPARRHMPAKVRVLLALLDERLNADNAPLPQALARSLRR